MVTGECRTLTCGGASTSGDCCSLLGAPSRALPPGAPGVLLGLADPGCWLHVPAAWPVPFQGQLCATPPVCHGAFPIQVPF